MPSPHNNTGAVAAAVERPNIFAAPVGDAVAARKRRPDHVFDAAAACDPTHLALSGGDRTRPAQPTAGRVGDLIHAGWKRTALLVGTALAIAATLVIGGSLDRHEGATRTAPSVPEWRDPAPASSSRGRASEGPRPRPIRKARSRKRPKPPARSRRGRPRPRPVQPAPAPRVSPAVPRRFEPPSRPVPRRPARPRLPQRVPDGAPPEFL